MLHRLGMGIEPGSVIASLPHAGDGTGVLAGHEEVPRQFRRRLGAITTVALQGFCRP